MAKKDRVDEAERPVYPDGCEHGNHGGGIYFIDQDIIEALGYKDDGSNICVHHFVVFGGKLKELD